MEKNIFYDAIKKMNVYQFTIFLADIISDESLRDITDRSELERAIETILQLNV